MFIKSDIRKVTIAVEKQCAHEVYLRLGRAGIVQPAGIRAGDALTDAEIAAEEARTRDILAGAAFVLNALQIDAGEMIIIPEKTRDIARDADFVSRAKQEMESFQNQLGKIQEEKTRISEQLDYAAALGEMGIEPGAIKQARLLRAVFGRVAETVAGPPAKSEFSLAAAGPYIFGAVLPEDAPQMIEYLKQYGFEDKTADVTGESLEGLKNRESALGLRMADLKINIDSFREKTGPSLKKLYRSYLGYEEVIKAMRLAGSSKEATFISGWIDARDWKKLVSLLREACSERFVLTSERDPNAPVRLMNPRLFRPFELLVRTMGMPANSEIDPTPLAAVTFIIIFGLMFGDLGQGLVLALTGLALKFYAGKKGNRESLGQAGGILFACGLSAAFCGILYGSVFSSERIIPALWMNPAENIMTLFYVTIFMGAAIIMVGMCVNIINSLINADYQEAVLGKTGAAILIPYGAIVLLAIRYASRGRAPALWETGVFVVLPLLIFLLRSPIESAFSRKGRPRDISGDMAESVMSIVEVTLGMFTNTISFIRVGAFALAHAGLGIVTFTLAGMSDPGLKSPAAVMILVSGNIFIIGFEGLIVAIQSMRLEYYEFFSKFFKGNGLVFTPFVLKSKSSEV